MSQNRRDFIKSSAAFTLLTVSSAPAALATRNIGMFHTTQISDQDMACFQAGLATFGLQTNPPKKGEAYGAYGGSHGRRVLHRHIRGGNVDVIVAAGGVTSQMAASEFLTNLPIPFVYMSGLQANPASSVNGKYCGVILNVPARYETAMGTKFRPTGIDNNYVWLIQNYNADMTPGELAGWAYKSFRFFEAPVPIDNPDPDPSNSMNVQAAFDKEWKRFLRLYPLPTSGQAIGLIINPDPYFRQTAADFKASLRAALGNAAVVCYPFSDYNPTSPDFLLPGAPTLSSATPADPNNAYYQLGVQVGTVLNASSLANPIPAAPIPSKIWNGASWINL